MGFSIFSILKTDDFKYGFLIIYHKGDDLKKEIPSGSWNNLLIVCSGLLKIKVDDNLIELNSQCCIMFSKNVFSEIKSTSEEINYFQIQFTSEFFFEFIDFSPRIFIEFFVANTQLVFKIDDETFDKLSLILNLLHKNFEKPHDVLYSKSIRYNFGLLLMELASAHYQNRTKEIIHWRAKRVRLVSSFYQLIEEHFSVEHYVEFYAGELSVTPAHLGRVVKEITGKSARQIIDEFLIFEAKRLIRSSDFSISKIGIQLGFSSLSLFSYYFKKHTGLSPYKYRSKQ